MSYAYVQANRLADLGIKDVGDLFYIRRGAEVYSGGEALPPGRYELVQARLGTLGCYVAVKHEATGKVYASVPGDQLIAAAMPFQNKLEDLAMKVAGAVLAE